MYTFVDNLSRVICIVNSLYELIIRNMNNIHADIDDVYDENIYEVDA